MNTAKLRSDAATTMKATLVTDFGPGANGIVHKLFRCDPGGPFPEFVIVSVSDVEETRVFACNSSGASDSCDYGNWLWHEDYRDHERCLRAAGYDPDLGDAITNAIKQAERALIGGDKQDALRVIHAATTIAAIPGMISADARALATRRLREMMHEHPNQAEVFAAIVQHLESYP